MMEDTRLKNKHTIPAVMDDGVPMMLSALEEKGIDVSKCFICEAPIVRTEREPRYLDEKLKCWWARVRRREVERYYEWNTGAFYHLGVVCEEMRCFRALMEINRTDSMLKQIINDHGQTRPEAIEWMKGLGYDVSRLEDQSSERSEQ